VDPTHVREYRSEEELLSTLAHPELSVGQVRATPLRFPLLDLALRAAAAVRLLSNDALSGVYARRPSLVYARRLPVRVPGYRLLEVAGGRR